MGHAPFQPADREVGRYLFFRPILVRFFRHQGRMGGKFELPAVSGPLRPLDFVVGHTGQSWRCANS